MHKSELAHPRLGSDRNLPQQRLKKRFCLSHFNPCTEKRGMDVNPKLSRIYRKPQLGLGSNTMFGTQFAASCWWPQEGQCEEEEEFMTSGTRTLSPHWHWTHTWTCCCVLREKKNPGYIYGDYSLSDFNFVFFSPSSPWERWSREVHFPQIHAVTPGWGLWQEIQYFWPREILLEVENSPM